MSRGSRSESPCIVRKRGSPKRTRSVAPRAMAKVCVDYVCCKGADSSSPCPTAADCPECLPCTSPPPAHASPCLDASHISSACTEPVCSAATSSTTPICTAAALPCCDAPDCADSPASPCAGSVCDVISPCPAIAATCCTDIACETEAGPLGHSTNICDGLIVADPVCNPHSNDPKCPDCRGSVSEDPHQGRMYSSFQELLDCCCCSMPPAADQCCVGAESHDRDLRHCDLPHSSGIHPASTPSSGIHSQTSMDIDLERSRSSTVSTTLTPPYTASPLHSHHYHRQEAFDSSSSLLRSLVGDLRSWDDCSFIQPHLHSTQGGCLPPSAPYCNSNSCETVAPHSHWMPTSSLAAGQDARPQSCQWAGCQERFWTVEELVAHVNHSHLAARRLVPDVSTGPSPMYSLHSTPQSPALMDETMQSLSCLWKDCQQVPQPVQLAQSPATTGPDEWMNDPQLLNDKASFAMLQHLLHDHLGQQDTHKSELDPTTANRDVTDAVAAQKRRRCDSCSGDEVDDDTLRCRWEGCSQVFPNHSQLTEHITRVHVGSGKNEYECRWAGCERHAEGKTFSQKQKVLRHIQTHTGDRPFKCDMCGKRFSEPNTLAQHIRTHTQEKPYVCDFPGCGKAFAVAGSLTIHKRIHSGAKPFVCGYPGCDKAFAESSNLTKHIRTHTGHKPFECPECGKGFSRPDQLTRHRKTHERKLPSAPLRIRS